MCEKCIELDEKIAHHRELAKKFSDKTFLEGISTLIAKYEAEKKALHPDKA